MEILNETKEQHTQQTFQRMTEPQTRSESLFAMFVERINAERAIEALKRNDFAQEDIKLLPPLKNGTHDFVYKQRTSVKVGVVVGAISGFFIMGLVGVFLGSSQPEELGMASWIVATVVASLIGLVVGAAMGALVGIGTPRTAGKRYGFYLKEGGIVLRVHVKDEEERQLAARLMEKHKGQDISILQDSEIWSTILPEKKKLAYQ